MKRWNWTVAMTMLIGFSFFGFRQQLAVAKGPLAPVDSYTIYYGTPTEQAMSRLKSVDMAIIEPSAYTERQLNELRAAGTLLIGYISVMEAPVWNNGRMQQVQPQHYYQPNGQKIHFPEWDSYLMDLRQPGYRDILLEEIRKSVIDKGLNGIFLDTVGDIDDYVNNLSVQREMREAYRTFLQQLSGRYGEIPVIQNRGFDTLDHAVPYIQGMLWEDWKAGWQQDDWMRNRVQRLQKEQKRGLKVFSVSSSSDMIHGKAARKLQYVHLNAPEGYSSKVH